MHGVIMDVVKQPMHQLLGKLLLTARMSLQYGTVLRKREKC